MKDKITISIVLILLICLCSTLFIISKDNNTSNIKYNIDIDNSDLKIDFSKYKKEVIKLNKSLEIKQGGVYELSGNIENGYIYIDTVDDVKLIFNNISIKNNNGSCIYIENSNNTIIELKDNSINRLEDSDNYKDIEIDSTIYSKDDLIIQGDGILDIKSNFNGSITSNDDLKIVSGTYIINSKGQGIKGKDSIYIKDGDFTINSIKDSIKSSNNIDSLKGFILIENGKFNINSQGDALQSENNLIIKDGSFDITTKEGSKSTKGIKTKNNLVIEGGLFNIDTIDDAIHSDNIIGISNSKLYLKSNDTCIKSNSKILLDSNTIKYNKCRDNIKSNKITTK